MTEEYRCPLSGSAPGDVWRYDAPRAAPGPDAILVPGRVLSGPVADEQAEHERAMLRAHGWSRGDDGHVYLWVER